ncbi:helix-turn-helix domain-containing protein [Nesterenkonia sp. CL21]|uniref:helix-turn-helix domain-containing protein n=1 Tax=Nesterenkonia sp. CL21 TaxID=3064894 RepID=UPI002879F340|nr:helix-turn-helix domain-containing protein [Nesterenkonia sp. CL21]MDS2173699.1 helix-turn-helix domain-containing protein [Nesterenkonia sp. CL21]
MGKHKNLVIVKAVIEQGLSVSQTARKYGISRQWVYTLLRRYQQHGPEALTTSSRTPTRHFRNEGHKVPSMATIRRLLRAADLVTDEPPSEPGPGTDGEGPPNPGVRRPFCQRCCETSVNDVPIHHTGGDGGI